MATLSASLVLQLPTVRSQGYYSVPIPVPVPVPVPQYGGYNTLPVGGYGYGSQPIGGYRSSYYSRQRGGLG